MQKRPKSWAIGRSIVLVVVLAVGVLGAIIVAAASHSSSPQTTISVSSTPVTSTTVVVVNNSTSTVTLSSVTPGFPTTEGSAQTTVTDDNISLASCTSLPSLLTVLPSVFAQPQVVSSISGYSNWVVWGESNETTSYSARGVSSSYSDTEIEIYSLKADAPVQCNVGDTYINLQLSLLVPLANGQYNASGTQVVPTGCEGVCYAGNNTETSITSNNGTT